MSGVFEETGTMDAKGGQAPAEARPGSLVVMYAEQHERLAPAYTGDPLVLGRDPPRGGCVIPGNAASRLHAKVHRTGDGWTLTDLGSRNGTLHNGVYVSEVRLEHGDELRVGNAMFRFVEEPPDEYLAFRLDGEGTPTTGPAARVLGGAQMDRVRRDLSRIAPTALSVLVLGETGTGKEVISSALHAASGRRGDLVAVNCAAIPTNLLESELCGHVRGAFTGADRDRVGFVKQANGGTLLLDEIGDMPLDAQAKVLRLLETREVVPVGSTRAEKVDVRLLCATHRDLRTLVARGTFRGDLYARINGHAITLPPLRDRKEDVFLLARHFLAGEGRPALRLSLGFMVAALHYDWPFNVRELRAAVQRAIALADGDELTELLLPDEVREQFQEYGARLGEGGQLPSLIPAPDRPPGALAPREAPTRDELVALLRAHAGSVAGIARALARDRVQIRRWLKHHELTPDDYRSGE